MAGDNKGFEKISRETLQNNALSLSARGLLANIASYHENWVLRKTEIRERFATESPKAVDRYWDELVAHNYILQFRKRDGKKYDYQYFYRVNKFAIKDIADLIIEMTEKGYFLYHKEMAKSENKNSINYLDYIFVSDSDKDKIEHAVSTCSFGLPKTRTPENADNTTFVELPISTSPNRQSNKDLSKRDLNKDIDDDDIYISAGEQKNQSNDEQGESLPKINHSKIGLPKTQSPTIAVTKAFSANHGTSLPKNRDIEQLTAGNETLTKTDRLLRFVKTSITDRFLIIQWLTQNEAYQSYELIEAQIHYMLKHTQRESISSFSRFFEEGIKRRYNVVQKDLKQADKYAKFEIPLYSWTN